MIADAESAASAPPEAPDPAASGDGAGLDGDVQSMLDEVNAAKSQGNDSAPDEPGEAELIDEIDRMLASGADEALNGNFETVEEMDQALTPEPEPEPEPVASPSETDDGELDLDTAGEIQSMDEMLAEEAKVELPEDDEIDDPAAANAPTIPLEAEASSENTPAADPTDDVDGDFASAGDVAAELDEIENMAASEATPPPPPAESPAKPVVEETVIAEEDKPQTPPGVMGILAKVNGPVMKMHPLTQAMVGCIAIGTLLLALACIIKAILGTTVMVMLLVPLMSLQAVAVYILIVKPNKPPKAEAEAPAEPAA